MPRSPQADNWLRETTAIQASYSFAIVPSPLKDGYLNYFDNVIRKRNYKVIEHRYRESTIHNMLHPTVLGDLQAKREEFIRKYPHTRDAFGGLQSIIVNKNNSRPFPRDFDEDEFLAAARLKMMSQPRYPNGYATAIRYNIGNGVVTSLPILVLHVNIDLDPIQMRPFDS